MKAKQLRLPGVPFPVQRPDYRNNGKYQFITGYTGGGNPECVHLSFEEIEKRLTKRYGEGTLIDNGEDLFWTPK